jgi:hypothetical protein
MRPKLTSPNDDPIVVRYHEARDAIWAARPRDLSGLAVQLKMIGLTVEDNELLDEQLETFDHVIAQTEALAA